MKTRCLIGYIREMSNYLDEQVKTYIQDRNLQVRQNHIPMFYLLPEEGDGMLFNELMTRWGISKSSLSDAITRYEAAGLVSKCSCNEDKRSVYIHLTDNGRAVRDELTAVEDRVLNESFKDFSGEEKKVLEKMIDRVLTCDCSETEAKSAQSH